MSDNLTGLIWLKDAYCFGNRSFTYAFSDANHLASGSCGLTDGSKEGDWRLPNARELYSLIDFGHTEPALPDGHPFIITEIYSVWWTSTTFPQYNSDSAWGVTISSGTLGLDKKWNIHLFISILRRPFHLNNLRDLVEYTKRKSAHWIGGNCSYFKIPPTCQL
ncbi:MAG: DUF1566 domain-containing protein [Anaerolineales bacterium]